MTVNFFITRQHAMHAERDIVMVNLLLIYILRSVCLSVCPMPVQCLNEGTRRHILRSAMGIILVFLSPGAVTQLQVKPPARTLNAG